MKRIIWIRVFFSCFLLCISNNSFAGIEKLMKHAASGSMMSNTSKAAVIKDQQGGYLTGGSMLFRGPRPKTLQPLVVQTPKFAYDACTGSADFRFGGLSYISSKEFSSFFKNMGTAAGAYLVKMFIKTSCPQCEDIMSYLETVSRDINGLMTDQCSSAQAIAGGVFNSLNSSNQQTCLMQGNINKSSKDLHQAMEKCKANPERHGELGKKDELKSLLGNEFNLVWKAIAKSNAGDTDFKELIMSVSGTIIGRKVDGSFHFTSKPSLVLSNDLLEQYIGISKGKKPVKLYKCDTSNKCLSPVESEIILSDKETIYGNVSRILERLVPKIKENKTQLTDEEEDVIAFSSIPLLQIIEMELAEKSETSDMMVRMSEFIEVVCYDVMTNFLSQMINQASASVQSLEYAQLDDAVIKKFTSQVAEVRSFLTSAKFSAFKRLQVITQVKERLQQQQRAFRTNYFRSVEQSRHS